MRRALAAVATLTLAHATAAADGMYAFGVDGGYGTALVLPTSSAVTSTGLSYREVGGAIGNAILFIGASPSCGVARTSVRYETDTLGNTYEITTKTSPSQAEVDVCRGIQAEWYETVGKRMLRGEMGQELNLDVPLRALGGDTSGFAFSMWRPVRSPSTDDTIEVLGEGSSLWIAQYHISYLTFHGVTSRRAIADGGVVRSMTVTGDQDYVMIGSGVRLYKSLTDNVRAMVQLDLNVMSIVDDEPSPFHLGLDVVLPHVLLHVEGVTSGINPSGFAVNAGVSVAL